MLLLTRRGDGPSVYAWLRRVERSDLAINAVKGYPQVSSHLSWFRYPLA